MKYRIDPKTGNNLSVLGLGCMRFPGTRKIDMQKTEELIVRAIELGINYFDTAYIYNGSEEALGAILEKNKLRSSFYIATKLPQFLVKSSEDFDRYFDRQLKRLKTDYVDYYLIHFISDVKSWERLCYFGIIDWLKQKRASGSIRAVGFSFHGAREDFLGLIEVYDWDFCQIQYNYSDENFQAGVSGLKKAHELRIPVIIMEPLLGGKLASGLPNAAVLEFAKLNPTRSPAVWGLNWLWDQEEVTTILSGMNDLKMLEENCLAADNSSIAMLGDAERDSFANVKQIFNSSFKVHCTGCSYCMPCPSGVNIPACFSAFNAYYSIGKSIGKHQYRMSVGAISATQHFASQCIKCGKCEKHCPQNIKIMENLVEARELLEPFWLRQGSAVLRKLFRLNKKT